MLQAVVGEEANLINIPRWEEEPDDTVLGTLTSALLKVVRELGNLQDADLRLCTEHVTQLLQQHAGKRAASKSASECQAAIGLKHDAEDDSGEECESMDVEHARKMLQQHSDFRQTEAVGA